MNDQKMGNHVHEWLNAYHDGELYGRRLARVENHLEHCPECQQALAELESLSALLQADLLPKTSISPEQFVSQVGLRLPRQSQGPSRSQKQRGPLNWYWAIAPLAIMGMVWFLQSVTLVTNLLTAIEVLGINPQAASWLLPAQSAPHNPIQSASMFALDLGVPLDANLFIAVILPLILAGGYLLWLALWWIDQEEKELPQPVSERSH
jgi:anti-sigma factor RsiW